MKELEKDMIDGNLTQKEIIQLLLHNAQHMATREEVKADIKELREDIKEDYKELKQDNKDLAKRMDRFMFWSLGLTVTSTFLILGLIYKIIPQ
ncbi:hypothetical protein JHD48_03445 [Sulfurimonas sp. SAG-AH-194-I05]|nr:hypothetical protein [Sulfurimonas sp. SAG-AH-194-I05]MDF1874789.1 hypothetical protein [Sulfurimonas sp. SAG-AH-194-I05]